ncbi:RNA polymerase sigma factor [Plectonema cf. radiosum LEGE 06105]|uniref:RNA polymerase sigma factor n=1 Tax=Plectonema cf. radiosum LEGE 06105 TaxID=945769 RepID=A0A8J7EXN8_9CYAN|nr:RNA polymerase sigma factor [Plectonema radiosum]MBE9212016.1 RNA polymerase sigma factor [Plectonema cf. radiosum LEGE 06105]
MSNQIAAISQQKDCADFWLLWQEHQNYLYHRCLGWMGGNPTEAEDALSRAMLKASEKVQEYAGKITNYKGWLTRLTHNLCVDIHRQHSRSANQVEDIEAIGDEQALVCSEDTPEIILETQEKNIQIRRAIENLPSRLRETFALHFYQQLSYREIAQQQEISYDNVCKRISQARKILREELREYFIGEDERDRDLYTDNLSTVIATAGSNLKLLEIDNKSESPTDSSVLQAATESVSEEVSQESGGVTEYVVSVAVEESQEESVAIVEGFEEKMREFLTVAILVLMEFDETGVLVQEQYFEAEFVRVCSDSLGVWCHAPPDQMMC